MGRSTKVHRILVIRLSAMGDVAISVPVVESLRKNYPESEITMLCPAFLQPFFERIEGLDFYSPDLKGRHKRLWSWFRLGWELGRFDAVADLHDVLRTKSLRPILRLRGARVVHIDKGRKEKKALIAPENKALKLLKSSVERYREVFLRLGFDLPEITPYPRRRLPLTAPSEALLGSTTVRKIGIAPFAQHEGKIYPLELMEQVIEQLCESEQNQLYLFGGGKHEQHFAQQMEQRYSRVRSAIGRITLSQEMELISNLDVMVSMDSSAMHIASLFGLPVLSIWGATHPYAGFYGLGQAPENALQLPLECRPCSIYGNKPCHKEGSYECMHKITPESVVEHLEQMLKG